MPVLILTYRPLTSREEEVLDLLCAGSSNKDIACTLDITEATVKMHVKHILAKIRLKNRTQAAVWATTDKARQLRRLLTTPEAVELSFLNGTEYNPMRLQAGREDEY